MIVHHRSTHSCQSGDSGHLKCGYHILKHAGHLSASNMEYAVNEINKMSELIQLSALVTKITSQKSTELYVLLIDIFQEGYTAQQGTRDELIGHLVAMLHQQL